ncbi:hypothetical protein F4Z99_09500 [Candidatus Poribacteria bacterium]|nr:hypothetical protein [Candidatus Poribacteria bacterium]
MPDIRYYTCKECNKPIESWKKIKKSERICKDCREEPITKILVIRSLENTTKFPETASGKWDLIIIDEKLKVPQETLDYLKTRLNSQYRENKLMGDFEKHLRTPDYDNQIIHAKLCICQKESKATFLCPDCGHVHGNER